MEQLKNEQTELNAQATEVEKEIGDKKEEVSLGKFKDVQSLLSAYNSLESEFTKRCQKIKELESKISSNEKTQVPLQGEKEVVKERLDISEEEKKNILKDYLNSVLYNKQTAIVMDGGGVGVKTPKIRPKSIKEAGDLAKEIFNK